MREWRSARTYAESVAYAKVLKDVQTDRILGAHILGHGAEEIIHIFALAIKYSIPAHELADGVCVMDKDTLGFPPGQAPTDSELAGLVQMISQRIGRYLEHQGLLVRDIENSYLNLESMDEYEERNEEVSFPYVCSVEVSSFEYIPEGMTSRAIPEQTYAKFTYNSPLTNLHETLKYIWRSWLPKSKYEYQNMNMWKNRILNFTHKVFMTMIRKMYFTSLHCCPVNIIVIRGKSLIL